MWINIIIISISFIIVIKGADFFVKGASSVAIKLGMSPFVVGLTIVAIGTSAPELVVNVMAVLEGSAELSIGNIIGSNIINILFGLGLAALFVPLTIKKATVWKEMPFLLMSVLMILILGADYVIDGFGDNVLSRSDGLVLLTFFIIFMVYTFGLSKDQKTTKETVKNIDTSTQTLNNQTQDKEIEDPEEKMEVLGIAKSIIYIIGGIAALLVGGNWIVNSAVIIAEQLGMSENLIGLTIVAIGTSLPEIVTSIVGVRKGHTDLVVGGIVGSCIFNALFVLGVTAGVGNLPFTQANLIDALVLAFITLILFIFMFIGKKHVLQKWQGIMFLLIYVAYIIFAIWRG
jgi:cation:H+ antiporter